MVINEGSTESQGYAAANGAVAELGTPTATKPVASSGVDTSALCDATGLIPSASLAGDAFCLSGNAIALSCHVADETVAPSSVALCQNSRSI